jgi:hypothetical protein
MQKRVSRNSNFRFSLEDHQLFKFDLEQWVVPKAVVENEKLVFKGSSRKVRLPDTLLEEFASLADVDSNSICAFANNWGRLGLCKHGLPSTHSFPGVITNRWSSPCKELPSEELAAWRLWSRKFRVVWNSSMMLHLGEHGNPQDWEIVLSDVGWSLDLWRGALTQLGWGPGGYWKSKSLIVEWGLLLDLLNYYIDLSGIRLRFTFDTVGNDASRISTRLNFGCPLSGSLFGALVLQLVFAVTNTEGGAICTSCGMPFFPKRRPKTGQRRFCDRPTCGRKAANRHAARDFRRGHPNYRRQFD